MINEPQGLVWSFVNPGCSVHGLGCLEDDFLLSFGLDQFGGLIVHCKVIMSVVETLDSKHMFCAS